jgi:rifampicin phosphotransferase
MQSWTVPLSSTLSENIVGRKAAALGRLVEAGFPVPRGVCITTAAYQWAAQNGAVHLPDGLLEEVRGAFPSGTPLAVRSSAIREDLPEASLAGRYTTRLNVLGPAALESAILDCWRSTEDKEGMAVLVQPMLDAECAGVCFTVDPVRQQPDMLIVVSGWGLGAGVVNGSVPTDTVRIWRENLKIEEQIIANKHSAVRSVASGVAQVDVPENLRGIPCLPEEWLERIGQFGLAIEQMYGGPQDIEWAVADGHLWILQNRPITALPAAIRDAVRFPIQWADNEESQRFWWLDQGWAENLSDRYAGPGLPAEISFILTNTRGGQDAVYFAGLNGTRYRKSVNGRIYMSAARSPHSPAHVRVYGAANRDLLEWLKEQDITLWEYYGPVITRACRRLATFDPHDANGDAVADHLEDAVATSQRHWMVHTSSGPRPIRSPALRDAIARLTGMTAEDAAAEVPFLLTSGGETVQTRLVETLYDLACLALAHPEAAKVVVMGEQTNNIKEPPDLEAFTIALQSLVEIYGDRLCLRTVPGFTMGLPMPWREAPEHIWEMIAAYISLVRERGSCETVNGAREDREASQRAVEERIEEICTQALQSGIDPTEVDEFRHRLAFERRNVLWLEEHNHYIDEGSEGQFFQAMIYAGRWLAGQGCLPGPYEVYWLKTEEVLAALRNPTVNLSTILIGRKAQFAEWRSMIAPSCLGLPDPYLPQRQENPVKRILPLEPADLPADMLIGQPASRGKASGRARITHGDVPPADLGPGDVLIAPYAGPVLTPFLPAVAALVIDYGSPGDHAAITAREFGLPVVCGTLHATQKIPEGAWVTVDAENGVVRLG